MLPILIALISIGLDQLTKWVVMTRMAEFETIPVIPGFFSFQLVFNPGAAFGILRDQRWLFIAVTLLAIGGMLYYLRHPEAKDRLVQVALGFLIGGAAGNLIDRMRFGKVVDFFLFYWKEWSFPNFNVADISINVGVGLMLLYLALTGEKIRREGV